MDSRWNVYCADLCNAIDATCFNVANPPIIVCSIDPNLVFSFHTTHMSTIIARLTYTTTYNVLVLPLIIGSKISKEHHH